MLKFRTLTLVFLLLVSGAWAQVPNVKQDWSTNVLGSKNELQKELGDKAPYSSEVFEIGTKPAKISIDISGENSLVLTTRSKVNTKMQDHTFWVDAKLYKADGGFDYLDELDILSAYSKEGKPIAYDTEPKSKLNSKGNENNRGVFLHANDEVRFNLDRKYVKIEGLISIPEKLQGNVSNANVKVKNISTTKLENNIFLSTPR